MEKPVNPYEAGQAHSHHVDPSLGIPVTPVALGALLVTKFWVSLVGVVILVIVGLGLLSCLSASFYFDRGFMGAITLPLVVLLINLVLAVRLVQYGTAIGRLANGGSSFDFERAIEFQSKFWRLLGLVYTLGIALVIVIWVATGFIF